MSRRASDSERARVDRFMWQTWVCTTWPERTPHRVGLAVALASFIDGRGEICVTGQQLADRCRIKNRETGSRIISDLISYGIFRHVRDRYLNKGSRKPTRVLVLDYPPGVTLESHPKYPPDPGVTLESHPTGPKSHLESIALNNKNLGCDSGITPDLTSAKASASSAGVTMQARVREGVTLDELERQREYEREMDRNDAEIEKGALERLDDGEPPF